MAEPFIDLMAFAKGQEFAKQANWRDIQQDIQARTNESRLAQQEASFNLNYPVAQLGAKLQTAQGTDKLAELEDNRAAAVFESDLMRSVSGLPPAERGTAVALRIQDAAKTGSPRMVQAVHRMGLAQANNEMRLGNVEGAAQILRALPGADTSAAVQALAQWRDPKHYTNPEAIAAGGGELQPDGQVMYGKVRLSPERFALVKQREAVQGAFANRAEMLQPSADADRLKGEKNVQANDMRSFAQQLNAAQKGSGVQFIVNPLTQQLIAVPEQQAQAPAPAPAADPGGPRIGAAAPVRQMPTFLPPEEVAREASSLAGRFPATPVTPPAPAPVAPGGLVWAPGSVGAQAWQALTQAVRPQTAPMDWNPTYAPWLTQP